VFILKVVKVLCFDTLLQVLILKVVRVVSSMSLPSFARDGADTDPPAGKSSTQRPLRSEHRGHRVITPPPRVFWEKRLQAVENKGQELQNKRKEAAGD
jgi:hypothetical protein